MQQYRAGATFALGAALLSPGKSTGTNEIEQGCLRGKIADFRNPAIQTKPEIVTRSDHNEFYNVTVSGLMI